MKRILLLLIVLIYSVSLYSNDKTYMQFKSEFLNIPIENTLSFGYSYKQKSENLLLKSFIISSTAFVGSYVINKYCIPNDQLNKKRNVSIIAASITVGFSINYLYKTSNYYLKK